MKRILLTLLIILSFFFAYLYTSSEKVYSDEIDELSQKIGDLQKSLNDSQKASKPLESQLTVIKAQLDGIENRVKTIEQDIVKKRKSIEKGYEDLAKQKDDFNAAIRQLYMKNYLYSPFVVFVSSNNASEVTRIIAYQQKSAQRDRAIITTMAMTITDLENRKIKLEEEEKKLSVLKEKMAVEREQLAKVVKEAKDYQSTLSQQIAELSQKQQQLIAQKQASLNLPTSLGGGSLFCTDDRKIDPGFSNAFAFYTFGIPHRVGMNQYGANGRANAGQNYEDILRAYFDNFNFETKNGIRIKVQGFGEMDLEEYMLGIYEMPNSFHIEALKAQAIAARSYALSYTNNGEKEICTTQSCQVYKGGNKGGAWEQAVRDTAGKVIVSGGQVVTAWYASTAGGYTFKSGDVGWNDRAWTKRVRDTRGDVSSFSDLFEKAYDKESPCFYAAQGARNEYGKSAWLKTNEVADIVNVLQLAKKDSSTQKNLSQIDKSNPDGVETWSHDKVKAELRLRNGSVFNSISNVSVSWDSSIGRTTSITFTGDGGSITFSADEFRSYFNLRAPSNIQIVGGLYNVERR